MLQEKNIYIQQITDKLQEYLQSHTYSKVAVIVDENSNEHCLPIIKHLVQDATIIQIQSGEENKTLTTCEHIWTALTEAQFDRKSLVINLGGGVIGDMGGFCASTYKRGIDFIQIPTTLLSQVDASVGGKLGIDFHSFKNHIGLFREPNAVLIDSIFLKTLPQNEIRSGFAEIIKHCLIADGDEWQKIKIAAYQEINWSERVPHSVAIKAQVVAEDPEEKGWRKVLNFGHTIGHGIESHYLTIPGKKLLHGEAIAIGMITEAYISLKRGYLSEEELNEISQYILSVYGKVMLEDGLIDAVLPTILQDKKNEGKTINCTLLESIGKGIVNIPITKEEIADSLAYYVAL